ncbi:hypothetical protein AUK40_06365 [Candidatus Wirthbacteria bacterium CG2_30_54_11]|uniref:AAA domain-containing protein n=1 Tax=Candidatus Wirthbacteria bacterium CG2_30_54_11 TaxID=1817892 RepID=A0A1J5ID85_9BACT|nr:MAG: hypothetical protein AUK40_06365 [Candidatus Wirthbacteria bacterium CG2_30_54_11]
MGTMIPVRKIAVANQKGGVGKTTTTINLAYQMALEGYRILVIDLDPQGNATSGFGIDRRELTTSMYHAVVSGESLKQVIVKTGHPRLDLAPASLDLAGAEVEMIDLPDREFSLKNALSEVEEYYDLVFIDCPPSLGILTVNAFSAVNGIIVPVQCEYYALEGLGQLMQTYAMVQEHLNSPLTILGAILTMFDGRTNLAKEVVSEVRRFFGEQIFDTIVPRNVRLAEAPGFGQSIFEYDSGSIGARAYRLLADELIRRVDPAARGKL